MRRSLQALFAAVVFFNLAFASAGAAEITPLPNADASFTSGSLHVDRYGNAGTPLIFIPGLGAGPWSWSEQIAHFSKDHTVYALTLTGFDGTTFVPAGDLFHSFETDFWSMLDSQKIVKPVVIGHSLGGTLAFELASTHPEKLRGAIALDGLPVFPTLAMSTASQRYEAAEKLEPQIAGQTRDQLLTYNIGFMKSVGVLTPELVTPAATLESKSDPKAVGAWMAQDLRHDLRPQLAKMNVPFLELLPYAPGGAYTKEQTVGFYRSLVSGAPKIDVTVIEGARHFAMLDQPKAVDDAIAAFIAPL